MPMRGSWRGPRCRSAGAEVVVADGGRAALGVIELQPFDALVCDIAMPEYDGFALLNLIRERESRDGRFTPAVAVTAYAGEDSRRSAEAAGYQAFLSKPYELQDLVMTIARLRSTEIPRDISA